jgi:very-short-patch-repair endonuclease
MEHTSEATRNLAKRLRRTMSSAEYRLWQLLRANRLDGLHFRRQHPLGPYVLDFYCHAAKLAVEVDGGVHRIPGGREQDSRRDMWFAERDIRTLRLPVHLVENDINGALALIRREVRGHMRDAG